MKKKNKGSVTCTSTLVRKDSADYDLKQIKQKKKKNHDHYYNSRLNQRQALVRE